MKNWKIPAVIVALVYFFGYLVFSINWAMGMTRNILGILGIVWIVIILATVIWLLLVFPWKKMKIKLMDYGLIKDWKIPGIILVLLILAMTVRWSTVSSQTTSYVTIKYRTDNWNGAVYEQRYSTSGGYNEKLVRDPFTPIKSQDLTVIWGGMLTGSILWLLIAVSQIKKVDADKEYLKI